jgi:hypothetical protein
MMMMTGEQGMTRRSCRPTRNFHQLTTNSQRPTTRNSHLPTTTYSHQPPTTFPHWPTINSHHPYPLLPPLPLPPLRDASSRPPLPLRRRAGASSPQPPLHRSRARQRAASSAPPPLLPGACPARAATRRRARPTPEGPCRTSGRRRAPAARHPALSPHLTGVRTLAPTARHRRARPRATRRSPCPRTIQPTPRPALPRPPRPPALRTPPPTHYLRCDTAHATESRRARLQIDAETTHCDCSPPLQPPRLPLHPRYPPSPRPYDLHTEHCPIAKGATEGRAETWHAPWRRRERENDPIAGASSTKLNADEDTTSKSDPSTSAGALERNASKSRSQSLSRGGGGERERSTGSVRSIPAVHCTATQEHQVGVSHAMEWVAGIIAYLGEGVDVADEEGAHNPQVTGLVVSAVPHREGRVIHEGVSVVFALLRALHGYGLHQPVRH